MISVVIASYNGNQYIAPQLRSILAQLGSEDEVVVSDDASPDETEKRVTELNDGRIRFFSGKERIGYVANFSRAVSLSRGEFIFFSDQDDVWLPGKVEKLKQLLSQHACVATDARVVNEDLSVIQPSYFDLRRAKSFTPIAIFCRPPVIGATLACRRDFLLSVTPFPSGIAHDFWISFNAALRGELYIVKEPMILYRRHHGAVSLSASGRRRSLGRVLLERCRLLAELCFRAFPTGNS